MKHLAFGLFLLAALTLSPVLGWAGPCSQYADLLGTSEDPDRCICAEALRNLKATPPRGMKIVAVCALYWPNGEMIDLSAQAVSLDRYNDEGNIPFGRIFLKGEVRLPGTWRYEPSISGDAWFIPQPPLVPARTPLADQLASIKFVEDDVLDRFHVPPRFRTSLCFTADATISIKGLRLLIGQTDEAGTYPVGYQVLRASGFKTCAAQ